MEKEMRLVYLIIATAIIISLIFLIFPVPKNTDNLESITGLNVFIETQSKTIERGSYWNKVNNQDGSYNLEIYNSVVNQNINGNYIPINLTIVPSSDILYEYEANTSNYMVYFEENPTFANIVKYVKDSVEINFDPQGLYYRNSLDAIQDIGYSSPLPVLGNPSENSFLYNDVYTTGIHLKYYALPYVFKEGLVIDNASLLPPLTLFGENITFDLEFNLDTNAQHIFIEGSEWDQNSEKTTQNTVYIKDDSNNVIFSFSKPVAYDSNGEKTNCTYLFKEQGNKLYVWIKTPYLWLNDSQRVFPVYIDPSIEINTSEQGGGDAHVGSGGDADKNFGNSVILKTGSVARTYLKFNISAIPEDQQIDAAEICTYLKTKKIQTINTSHVYSDWQEDIITWNNQPCGTGFNNSTNCNLTIEDFVLMNESFQFTFRCFNVKNMISTDYENNKEITSMILTTVDADINEFSSKEETNPLQWPYLNITYSNASNQSNETNQTSYELDVYPQEYAFAARNNKDEINSFEISLYDNVDSTILVNISYSMIPGSNFSFLTSPGFVELNSFDNITNPVKINVSIQADSNILLGTYNGAVTLNVYSQEITRVMNLTYGINPPSGIPRIYNSSSTGECTSDFPSLTGCTYDFDINQDASTMVHYSAGNNGSFNLSKCYIRNLVNWSEPSILNFSLTVSEFKNFSITYNPTTSESIGVYYDQLYIDCLDGDSFGNQVTTSTGNRPINRIKIKAKEDDDGGSGSGGGGSGGGGGGGINLFGTETYDLEFAQIPNLIINPGENKRIVLTVKNTGKNFLNDCKLIGIKDYASWISSEKTSSLSPGQETDLIFSLNVPGDTREGEHDIELLAICKEFNETTNFIAEIIEQKLHLDLIDVGKLEDFSLKVSYSLEDLYNQDQNVEIEIQLFKDNEKIAESRETKTISKNSKRQFENILETDRELVGEFIVKINAKSEIASESLEEEVVFGRSLRIGGFAILDTLRDSNLFTIILIITFMIVVSYLVMRIIRQRETVSSETPPKKGLQEIIVSKVKPHVEKITRQRHKKRYIKIKSRASKVKTKK